MGEIKISFANLEVKTLEDVSLERIREKMATAKKNNDLIEIEYSDSNILINPDMVCYIKEEKKGE